MNDDQSKRDGVTGGTGLDDQATESPSRADGAAPHGDGQGVGSGDSDLSADGTRPGDSAASQGETPAEGPAGGSRFPPGDSVAARDAKAADAPAGGNGARQGSGPVGALAAGTQPGSGPADDPAEGDGTQPGDSPTTAAHAPVAGEQAVGDRPAGDQAAGDKPGAEQDGAHRPANQTGADEPGADQPGADQEASRKPARRRRSFWAEAVVLVLIALAVALLIKTFVVQAFYIPSSSMENTLLPGDKVLVNKVVYHLRPIHPGDIVVFDGAGSWDPVPRPAASDSNPFEVVYRATLLPLLRSITGLFGTAPGQTDYIKRVIGVPGDRVACCTAKGLVTVNGVPLHEGSYLYPGAAPSAIHFSIVVPPGRLWVMGDNRLVSDDSRLHTSSPGRGTIPEKMVIGRAFMTVWPPSRWRGLRIPATFEQPGISRASAAALAVAGDPAAPYLPLTGGVAVALPVTWLERRVRLGRGRARRR